MVKKFIVLVVAILLSTNASFADDEHKRTVSVKGKAKVSAEPDMATVNFSINSYKRTAEKAREANARIANDVLKAVKKLGIKEKDTKLQNLSIDVDKDYDSNKVLGYEARRSFEVKVNDLDKLPDLIAKVVKKGSNELSNVKYGLDDDSDFRNAALQQATQNAKAKAKLLVNSVDSELGEVMEIKEEYYSRPVWYGRSMALADSASGSGTPGAYSAGELEIEASVNVVFEIQ